MSTLTRRRLTACRLPPSLARRRARATSRARCGPSDSRRDGPQRHASGDLAPWPPAVLRKDRLGDPRDRTTIAVGEHVSGPRVGGRRCARLVYAAGVRDDRCAMGAERKPPNRMPGRAQRSGHSRGDRWRVHRLSSNGILRLHNRPRSCTALTIHGDAMTALAGCSLRWRLLPMR